MKTSAEIRQDFLDFFKSKQHRVVPSSSLVPGNDPTLLFTNAGMVQFKDVFLGAEKRSYTRAVSSQRCVRAGGKHNDLDSVGYTARHHTFFEMLGNFSFGDYFKRDAILWAWELLTKVWKLPEEKLLVTIYHTDDEAFEIWNTLVGIPADRIIRIGDNKGAPYASDNFWQMADTGPCGPCSEIFYDHGAHIAGGPPGSPDEDGDRFIEIWNNVFMQFDRQADGTLLPLPAPCVDTGMGLERIAAVLQHVHSNYEIDLFQHWIQAAAKLADCKDLEHKSLRVISDHIRTCSFLIADGVLPSNEGRGYVLRRIIRRAVRHFWKLGITRADGLFWKMHQPLIDAMGASYPELVQKRSLIEQALKSEESAFDQTLDAGMMKVQEYLHSSNGIISGDQLFTLHDTYGCPPDLIADLCRENEDKGWHLAADAMSRYDVLMNEQRERARAAGKFSGQATLSAELIAKLTPTQFSGYDHGAAGSCNVLAVVKDGVAVNAVSAGERASIILDSTPFYAESGGQVGDTGVLTSSNMQFDVSDTQKVAGQFHVHQGTVKHGTLNVGDKLAAAIDGERRRAIVLHHSATHLLHAALREVLGDHVTQKGSLVAPDKLRFDFSHFKPISRDELNTIERMVNDQIRRNAAAETHHMAMQEALDFGAMALFGEKYGEHVRVLKMGDFSTELCGGTHVARTGDIGLFKITSESGVAAGVRRIEAVSGAAALDYVLDNQQRMFELAHLTGASVPEVADKVRALMDRQKELERQIDSLKAKQASGAVESLAEGAVQIGSLQLVAARLEGMDAKSLRDAMDVLKNKLVDAVIVLAGAEGGKVSLVAGVKGKALERVKAGELLSHIAGQIGGKGGGRPDMAQGGGKDGPELIAALAELPRWIEQRGS